jgi:uncharacterized protein DUF1706
VLDSIEAGSDPKTFVTLPVTINEVIIQAIPEEDLISSQRFAWTKGSPLWQLVAGDTYEHYQEHIGQIQKWLVQSR